MGFVVSPQQHREFNEKRLLNRARAVKSTRDYAVDDGRLNQIKLVWTGPYAKKDAAGGEKSFGCPQRTGSFPPTRRLFEVSEL